ncbi:hypothetical protein Tco_1460750, partial [Tanacetum coccineum]
MAALFIVMMKGLLGLQSSPNLQSLTLDSILISLNPWILFHVVSTSESIENVPWDDASGSHVFRLEGMSRV